MTVRRLTRILTEDLARILRMLDQHNNGAVVPVRTE